MSELLPFGRWMKQLRANLDLTQEALADAVGCAPQTIRTYESGRRRPSREVAERLADVLHVPAEQRASFIRIARTIIDPSTAQGQDSEHQHDVKTGELKTTNGTTALQSSPILTTKLYRPRPRAGLVSRPRLVEQLNAGVAGPLTIIAAPAGSGKTSLLTDWLSGQDSSTQVAWLALDPTDSDPAQFLRYLIAAVQTIDPRVGGHVLPLLELTQGTQLNAVLPLLVNELIVLPEQSILVLDDYHVIDAPAVHGMLQFLLEHLPPQVHFVIASRVDPPLALARFRVRGQLTEVRAHDLRFTVEEAAAFLHDTMGLALHADQVAALETHTEGWVAGLQLAALSLRNRPGEQQAQFIAAFTASHRFVVDYLVDEVLAQLPPHLQTFLLQTSILGRLCGPLCDAVILGRDRPVLPTSMGKHAYSQPLLEELERANVFIIPLDNVRHWYRYHHLFAQVLRERLSVGVPGDAIAALHRNASSWHEQHGYVTDAVYHALAGSDWDHAARLIEAHGRRMMVNGQVHTVRSWLTTLPEPVIRLHPYLYLVDGLGLFTSNQLDAAERRLEAAEAHFATHPASDEHVRSMLGYSSILRAGIAVVRGDIARCLPLAQQGLERLPATDVSARVPACIHLDQVYLLNGDVSPANEHRIVAHAASARDAGELANLFYATVTLADFQRRQGHMRAAVDTYHQAAQVVPDPEGIQSLPDAANYYFGLGTIFWEWNDLVAAESLLAKGLDLVRSGHLVQAESAFLGYTALARLAQAYGAGHDEGALLAELQAVAHERGYAPHISARAAAVQAQLELMQGNINGALQWAETSGLDVHDDVSYVHEEEYLTLARVRIANRASHAAAYGHATLSLLQRLLKSAEAGGRGDSVIKILVLQALALQVYGNDTGALASLTRALELAGPEGYIRTFIDEGASLAVLLTTASRTQTNVHPDVRAYADRLRAHVKVAPLATHTSNHSSPLVNVTFFPPDLDPLTTRELEVLRLLAAGMSNQAIASELIVAVGTVKRHVNSILSKLAVQSRLQAVARARELNLI